MVIKSLKNVDKKPMKMDGVKDVFKQLPIGSADGTPHFSFRVFTVGPNGHTPYHRHDSEHVNYIISGNGAIQDENGDLHPVREGDFCLIDPGEKHQYRNLSDKDELVLICAVMKEYE